LHFEGPKGQQAEGHFIFPRSVILIIAAGKVFINPLARRQLPCSLLAAGTAGPEHPDDLSAVCWNTTGSQQLLFTEQITGFGTKLALN